MRLVQIMLPNKNNAMKWLDVRTVTKDKVVGHKIIIISIQYNLMELLKEYNKYKMKFNKMDQYHVNIKIIMLK